MPEWFVVGAAGLFGLAIGSFLNVCIIRLPADESLVHPPSRCPTCGTPIPWYDNVPVASWIALRGKCRSCRTRISIQYPVVEAATAALWMSAAWYYGFTVTGVGAALFGSILLGITVTDAQHMIIPHEFTFGGLVIGLGMAAIQGWAQVVQAALGAVSGFALIWSVGTLGTWAFKKEAMGGGDVWMMTMVGAFVGWSGVLLTVLFGAFLGTIVYGPIALLQRRQGMLLPFGVFLAPAAAATFVVGDAVWAWYVGVLGLH